MISDPMYCEGCKGVNYKVIVDIDEYMAQPGVVIRDEVIRCIDCGSSDLVDYDEKAAEIRAKMKIVTECKYGRYWYAWDENSYDGEPLSSHEDEDEAIDDLILETIEAGTYN